MGPRALSWAALIGIVATAYAHAQTTNPLTNYFTHAPVLPSAVVSTDAIGVVRSGVLFKLPGTAALLPLAPTALVQGLNITQGATGAVPAGGSGCGIFAYTANCIQASDQIDALAGGGGPGKSVLSLYDNVTGPDGTGNGFALSAVGRLTGLPTSISNSTFVGGDAIVGQGDVPTGGTVSTDPGVFTGKGNIFGSSMYCIIQPSATGYQSCEGLELAMKIGDGASVTSVIGIDITKIGGGPTQGTALDTALVIDVGGSSASPTVDPKGWKTAIQIGGYNGANNTPVSAGGTVMATYAGIATALDTGIDISGTWQPGTATAGLGFTYTGDFFKADGNNHWKGDGSLIATSSGINHQFSTTTNDQLVASFENAGGAARIAVIAHTAGKLASIYFQDGNVTKFEIGKQTDNTLFLFDSGTGESAMTIGSGGAGQVRLGEPGGSAGSQLTLLPAGGGTLTHLPTVAAGTGKSFVCMDTNGVLFRGTGISCN